MHQSCDLILFAFYLHYAPGGPSYYSENVSYCARFIIVIIVMLLLGCTSGTKEKNWTLHEHCYHRINSLHRGCTNIFIEISLHSSLCVCEYVVQHNCVKTSIKAPVDGARIIRLDCSITETDTNGQL